MTKCLVYKKKEISCIILKAMYKGLKSRGYGRIFYFFFRFASPLHVYGIYCIKIEKSNLLW